MRPLSAVSGLFLGVLLLSAAESRADWLPDVRLTNDIGVSSTSLSNAWCVASSGDSVYAVWDDDRDGNLEIYCKRSVNGGASWGPDTRLTNSVAESNHPSVSVSGSAVNVVWRDSRDGNAEIYFKGSTDGGLTWGADTRLSVNSSASDFPSMATWGPAVHVVWRDVRDGNDEVYYRRSTDGGVTWGAETRLTNQAAPSEEPSVAVSGSVVHVAWYDFRSGGTEIYYKRSTDGGTSWGLDTRLSNLTGSSYDETICVSGSVVHVVWRDDHDGNFEIYYKRSLDGGGTWGADTRLTNSVGSSEYPSVAVSESVVHVAWTDDRLGGWEIYQKRSTDGGTSWGADTRLTNNEFFSWHPSIAVSGAAVHVVWQDIRHGNWEIYYKRDPIGIPAGVEGTVAGIPAALGLEQSYPNPLGPSSLMTIGFQIPSAGHVRLAVYDVLGREVATLVSRELEAGTHSRKFDAGNLASGVYFYRLQAGDLVETKKFNLMK